MTRNAGNEISREGTREAARSFSSQMRSAEETAHVSSVPATAAAATAFAGIVDIDTGATTTTNTSMVIGAGAVTAAAAIAANADANAPATITNIAATDGATAVPEQAIASDFTADIAITSVPSIATDARTIIITTVAFPSAATTVAAEADANAPATTANIATNDDAAAIHDQAAAVSAASAASAAAAATSSSATSAALADIDASVAATTTMLTIAGAVSAVAATVANAEANTPAIDAAEEAPAYQAAASAASANVREAAIAATPAAANATIAAATMASILKTLLILTLVVFAAVRASHIQKKGVAGRERVARVPVSATPLIRHITADDVEARTEAEKEVQLGVPSTSTSAKLHLDVGLFVASLLEAALLGHVATNAALLQTTTTTPATNSSSAHSSATTTLTNPTGPPSDHSSSPLASRAYSAAAITSVTTTTTCAAPTHTEAPRAAAAFLPQRLNELPDNVNQVQGTLATRLSSRKWHVRAGACRELAFRELSNGSLYHYSLAYPLLWDTNPDVQWAAQQLPWHKCGLKIDMDIWLRFPEVVRQSYLQCEIKNKAS